MGKKTVRSAQMPSIMNPASKTRRNRFFCFSRLSMKNITKLPTAMYMP